MTHRFRLHCLGTPALFTVAGEQVPFRTRKHLGLLIRLALEPGKQFTRDYLADLLWPASPPKHANHSLAQGLSVIKAKIAREAVVLRRASVALAAGWIDVDVTHLTETGVAIDGPFLEAFEIPGARPFEDWKDEYRARLIPQVRDCLVRQMDAARRIGDFPTVEKHATRLQDLDPLAEEAIRGVMEARAWASDRSSALQAFARYEQRLAAELAAKPGPELIRMADLLRDGRRPTPGPRAAGYPPERADRRFEPETLIGREREFGVLYDAWLEARRKSPRIVVVTSDPGVGKTTLVNAFASSCQMEGAIVARAQAYDAERELPFAVLGELVKQLATQKAIGSADPEALSELTRISSEVVKAFPGVPKPVEWSPELTPLRIGDALLKTVSAAAVDSPIVLVIDDIHAADDASVAILHSLARKLIDNRTLIILAGRTSELRLADAPWAFISDHALAGLRTLELEVLPAPAAIALINRLAAENQRCDPPIDRILRATGRNPLAVELITREWAEHGDASLLGDLEALDTKPVQAIGIPRAIGAVFDRQARRLDASIRAALDLAAVLGRRLTEVALYSAIDLSPGHAAEALSRLREEGYLREVSGDLEFRNELIRAQAYYAVAAPTREHLHRRVAQSLIDNHSGDDKAICLEIAWHHLRGGDVDRAVPFAIEGAEAVLSVGAPKEAEEILRTILNRFPSAANAKTLLLLLAKACVDQSKAEPALPIIAQLTDDKALTLREQAEVAMLRTTAEFLLNNESADKYSEAVRSALAGAQRSGDADLVSRALLECARAGTDQGVAELVTIAREGLQKLKEDDLRTLPAAVLTNALCRMFFWDYEGCLGNLRNFVLQNNRKVNAAHMALMYSGIALASFLLCRMEESLDAYMVAVDLTKGVGDDARMSVLAANVCVLQSARGFYSDAIKWGEKSVSLGEASKSNSLQMAYSNLVDPYLLTGRRSEALVCIDKARAWLGPRRRWKFHCGFIMASASLALMQGNVGVALDMIDQLENLVRGREQALPVPGSYWKFRVFKEVQLGRLEEANRLAVHASRLLRDCAPLTYFDVLAARAWVEQQISGEYSAATNQDLRRFEIVGALGRRALLTAQGFLTPSSSHASTKENASTMVGQHPSFPRQSRQRADGMR